MLFSTFERKTDDFVNFEHFYKLAHGCPERGSIPRRFWKSKLGLKMVTTRKSIKSYVGNRKKNRTFQGKKKSYGGSKVGFGTFFFRAKK